MISDGCIAECFNRLGSLNYFPKEDGVLLELGKLFRKICFNDHEARLLVDAILDAGWNGHEGVMAAHASAVVPRRLSADGCHLCNNVGFLGRFRIEDRRPNVDGARVKYVFVDESIGEYRQETKLRQEYPSPAYRVEFAMLACSCALGQAHRERMEAQVGPYARYKGTA